MERKCACGCGQQVLGRPDKKYSTTACRRAAWRAKWKAAWLRKRPRKSPEEALKSVPDASHGPQSHPPVETASWRQAMEVLARRSPAFLLRLAAPCSGGLQAGKPERKDAA